MASQSQLSRNPALPDKMPRAVRYALVGIVAALLGSALYLVAVRGQALLVDLSALSQRIFCF